MALRNVHLVDLPWIRINIYYSIRRIEPHTEVAATFIWNANIPRWHGFPFQMEWVPSPEHYTKLVLECGHPKMAWLPLPDGMGAMLSALTTTNNYQAPLLTLLGTCPHSVGKAV